MTDVLITDLPTLIQQLKELRDNYADMAANASEYDDHYTINDWRYKRDRTNEAMLALESQEDETTALRSEVEGLVGKLAACSTAALGYAEGPIHDDFHSAALDDVMTLRKENDRLRAALQEMYSAEDYEQMCEMLDDALNDE